MTFICKTVLVFVIAIAAIAAFFITLHHLPESVTVTTTVTPSFDADNMKSYYSNSFSDVDSHNSGTDHVDIELGKFLHRCYSNKEIGPGVIELKYEVEYGLCLPPHGGGMSYKLSQQLVFISPRKVTLRMVDAITGNVLLTCVYERGIISHRSYPYQIGDDMMAKIRPYFEKARK